MKDFLKSMFSEGSEISSMRIMAMISLLIAGGLAVAGMYKGVSATELSILCGVFVGAAFGGKVGQKFAENKAEEKKE